MTWCVLLDHTHCSDGVEWVLNGEQQHFVSTVGVVCVCGPCDALAGGVVEIGLLSCDVNGLSGATAHAAVSALYILKLHQRLPLKRHHHHVAARRVGRRNEILTYYCLILPSLYIKTNLM